MPNSAVQALMSFVPREITPVEVELFRQWLGRAGDIPLAYVSERRSDDPRFYRRIVVQMDPAGLHIYTVHAPSAGTGSQWLVVPWGQPLHADVYDSLRDALNSIRSVLF
jgi:hypothetical protein